MISLPSNISHINFNTVRLVNVDWNCLEERNRG